jgi:hypothetical protein
MSESDESPLLIQGVKPTYEKEPVLVDGREILNKAFSQFLEDPRVFILGEDVGKIGDVNQTLAGLQEKFGPLKVTDTGIREVSIVGRCFDAWFATDSRDSVFGLHILSIPRVIG